MKQPKRADRDVWFINRKLCAKMPSLILIGNEFVPLWRHEDASVEGDVVCINPWRSGWTIIRAGSGWGRRRGAKYYYVDFVNKMVAKLKRTPTKNIYTHSWMDCVTLPSGSGLCFEWRDNRLVKGPSKTL